MKHLLLIMALVLFASYAGAQVQPPPLPPVPAAAPAVPGAVDPASVPGTAFAPATANKPAPAPVFKSLMISESDMARLYTAAQTYRATMEKARSQSPLAAAISPGTPDEKTAKTRVEHPQFFLALIAFNDPQNWTLWLNNNKYTAQTLSVGDVKVLEVEKTYARFAWRPKVFSAYEKRTIDESSREIITIKPRDETIEFTLYTNQSFSAYAMAVTEGFLPPVKIEEFITAVKVGTGAVMDQLPELPKVPEAHKGPLPPTPTTGMYDSPGKKEIDKEIKEGVH